MAFLEINPRFRSLLEERRLADPDGLLALPAVIVSGHPDRNVARVTLGSGPKAVRAFLKREHRVRWRDRLVNAWAGFGPVSKSHREMQTLRALERAGIGCPEWLAVGEDRAGRAFLLLEDLPDAVDLQRLLREQSGPSPRERRRVARWLGQALARMHDAGFGHLDLYAKHVLVDPCDGRICFLDWQRSRRPGRLDWKQRCRDLATLDATLTDDLATTRDRLAGLIAYVREAGEQPEVGSKYGRSASARGSPWFTVRCLADRVRLEARQLLRKRHVREARLCPPLADEGVVRLDGEALCVTHSFRIELNGRVPEWLRVGSSPGVTRTIVALPGGRNGLLIRRCQDQPLGWLWHSLRRRPLVSPELRQAGQLFRQLRQGVPAPRLLAFGQRRPLPWRMESFLLTELGPAERERAG